MNKIYLSEKDRKISGVCGGIAEAYGADSTTIRLVTLLVTVLTGGFPMVVAYIIAAAIIPKHPHHTTHHSTE